LETIYNTKDIYTMHTQTPSASEQNFRRQRRQRITNRLLVWAFFGVLAGVLLITIGSAVSPAVASVTSPLFCPAGTSLQARLPERLQLSFPVFFECMGADGARVTRVSGRLYALLFGGVIGLVLLAMGINATGGYRFAINRRRHPDDQPAPDVPVSMFPQTFLGGNLSSRASQRAPLDRVQHDQRRKLDEDYENGVISDAEYDKRLREIMEP
jgi:hypothetical protein